MIDSPQELNAKIQSGEAEYVKRPQTAPQASLDPGTAPSLDNFLQVLVALRQRKRHLTAAPTFKPMTFLDQVQFYDDGANRRIYLYVNNAWRYVALT